MGNLMKITILFLILILLAMPMLASGQEELSEPFATADGALTFEYPAGWVFEEVSGIAIGANDVRLAEGTSLTELDIEDLSSGQVFVMIIGSPAEEIAANLDLDANAPLSAMAVLEAFIQTLDEGFELIRDPEALNTSSDTALAVAIEPDSNAESVIAFKIVSEENVILMIGYAQLGEADDYVDALTTIADSASFGQTDPNAGVFAEDAGPTPLPGHGEVLWQQIRETGISDRHFGHLGRVAVADDGTIYVGDNTRGIRLLDGDGNLMGTLSNNSISDYDDIAIAPDGTLWVADSTNVKIYHLDIDGNLITFFGEAGSGPGQFGDGWPRVIEVDSEGNLYVFDNQDGEDGNDVNRIQVFDAEGNYLREISLGQDFYSVDMAMSPNDHLYVGIVFGDELDVFDLQGNLIVDNFGQDTMGFGDIFRVVVDDTENVYVADDDGRGVTQYDSDGNYVARYGYRQLQPTEGFAPPQEMGELLSIQGVGIMPNGDVIVADHNYGHAQIVRVDFTAIEE